MPTSNGDRVPFGLDSIIPTDTRAAWGARLIVTQDGHVDFLHDRQGCAGEDRDAFLNLLSEELPLDELRSLIRNLLVNGGMDTRVGHDFTIVSNDKIEVHADTNASGGYCYVTAFSRPIAGEA